MPDGSTSAKPRFRLAIIGGGIAGLTLAVTLGRYAEDGDAPIEVHIYENGPEITTVGAGISVWPRTWDVMHRLGLYEQLAEQSVQPPGEEAGEPKPAFIFRKSDWNREGYEFGRIMIPHGCTTMHRADMVAVLVKNLPETCLIYTSKRLVHYTETIKTEGERAGSTVYTLHFMDGTTSETDVLIGADGIRSKTRASMYDLAHSRECRNDVSREDCERCKRATPTWTGTVAYRYLIPSERMREVNPEHTALNVQAQLSYSGKAKHIITYPISHGKYLNWIGFVTIPAGEGTTYPRKWVVDSTQQEVAALFSGWEPEVDDMLRLVEKPTVWAIHVVQDLPFSVYGSVALMGDAMHAMQTHFGAGGGQAIEDAYILGRLLADSRTTLARVPEVFRIYQDVRLPFTQRVVNEARKAGLMYEFNCPGLYDGSTPLSTSKEEELELEKRQLDDLGKAIEVIWQWQLKERVEDQWVDARRRYEVLVGKSTTTANRGRKWKKGCIIM
ncbi:FAD/NAD(P)-binding domain-containing protein [Trametes sanguinea]|nr:FAD/NAD(P)-binding domain-containing protein [Trametes sanguinea]